MDLRFLVLLGAGLLAGSLIPSFLIILKFPTSSTKKYWIMLSGLIFLFLGGYLFYFYAQGKNYIQHIEILVPLVFFFGACFVLVISILSFQTLRAIQKIDVLERENITDPLMGIYNRRFFELRLKEETSRAKRYGLPLSLILFDIDLFKNINDKYGHRAADAVLGRIGQILISSIRDVDIAARYGGDEIAIISPNNNKNETIILASRLKSLIGGYDFSLEASGLPQPLHCSISVGVAALNEGHTQSDHLLQSADKAMYQAKAQGRNQVCVASGCLDEDN